MMDYRFAFYEIVGGSLGLGSYLVHTIWRIVRERNCCRELLAREQRSHTLKLTEHTQKQSELLKNNIERQNEQLRILATAFSSGEPITLDDLLSNAERDWSLRSSNSPPER